MRLVYYLYAIHNHRFARDITSLDITLEQWGNGERERENGRKRKDEREVRLGYDTVHHVTVAT